MQEVKKIVIILSFEHYHYGVVYLYRSKNNSNQEKNNRI